MKLIRDAVIMTLYILRANAFAPALAKIGVAKFSLTNKFELNVALTPVGPFCPFRSEAAVDLDPKMEQLSSAQPEFSTEMARIQLDLQMGKAPDPERLKRVADDIDQAVDQWERLIVRLRLSPDFQTKEFAKLTQTHLETHGVTVESIASMMRWQAGCLRAMANYLPPPMPPPDLDLQSMMEQAQDESKGPPPSITAMQAAQSITAAPFSPNSFTSATIKEEYENLVRDHSNLIKYGAKYDEFDPLGKIAYLNEIDRIEERWDVFFARFKLMGAINNDYKKQCDQFLASMNMTEKDYRSLLKKCHDLMRNDAERERDLPV